MPLVPFGEWKPDLSDYEGNTSLTISGVLPRGDGYGPMKASAAYSQALAGPCRGAFTAQNLDGSVTIFAATATDLYTMSNVNQSWIKRSKGGSAYSAIPVNEQWQFTQFNNFVIAVGSTTVPQKFDLTSPGNFVDLGGSPPTARYISTVGRFVVLTGLTTNSYRVQWSGLNDPQQWTSGVNNSDFQDLPDGGVTRGVAGGESGLIFQDNAIRRMTWAPGSDYVFLIERISQDKGLYAPYSLVRAGERIFFLNNTGFHKIDPGTNYPVEIGKERFDRYFLSILDRGNLQLVIGAADPRGSRVFWAFRGSGMSVAGQYTALICYDYAIDRASIVPMNGEYLVQMQQPGVTLEGLDAVIGGRTDGTPDTSGIGIDTPGTASLDSYLPSAAPDIAQFDTNHMLAFFGGSPIEATMDTAEQGTDGQRVRVRGLRPITDAQSVFGSCSRRESLQAVASYVAESQLTTISKICPLNVSTRYSRGRIRIPAGTVWSYAAGIEPLASLEGTT